MNFLQVETYLSHYLIIDLLILEVIALVVIFLGVLIRYPVSYFRNRRERAESRAIFQAICRGLEGEKKEAFRELKRFAGSKLLLKEVEAFSERLSGADWEHLKNSITNSYLRPLADRYFSSRSWINRNFAARVLALTAYSEDQALMIKLLEDPVFLVRSYAGKGLASLKTPEAILKLLERTCIEYGYARCFFRDLLLENESPKEFLTLEKLAHDELIQLRTSQKSEKSLLLASLDIIANKEMPISTSILEEALRLNDHEIERAVIKVYAKNPQPGSKVILLKGIKDRDDEVRVEAAEGLEHFDCLASSEALELALNDPVWRVRRAAAYSLKRRGPSGQKILRLQTELDKPLAWEAAQYALQFA